MYQHVHELINSGIESIVASSNDKNFKIILKKTKFKTDNYVNPWYTKDIYMIPLNEKTWTTFIY